MLNRFFKKKPTAGEKIDSIVKKSVRKDVKNILTGDDSLSIQGKQKYILKEINETATKVLEESVDNPEILLNYIKSKGTVIIKSKFMDKILWCFSEDTGFLPPMSGVKAFLFTIVINIFSPVKLKHRFKTPAMFALKDEPINIYTLAHQFHLWLSYVNKLPGFEEKTLRNFKDFWKTGSDSDYVSYLSVDEIFSLKDIIARELEALNFVKELGRRFEGKKKAFKKLEDGNSVNM